MQEGVKALFKFTIAILHLAFQVTAPSSCEVFHTIRMVAKDLNDVKLLLSLIKDIKLPKDSYFAIRRSFYMVQSSFNSDLFYLQNVSDESCRQMVPNKPFNVQQQPNVKVPAKSLMSLQINNSIGQASGSQGLSSPRVCTSTDRSKVCIQNLGLKGRSHVRIINTDIKTNERSLMSPLRNCLVIGISDCGKIIIVARQSSRRNFKLLKEQDLLFHVHELPSEIFDGFYFEQLKQALVLTHQGELIRITYNEEIDTSKSKAISFSTETLLLRECHTINDNERLKLRFASLDVITNLLWIYVDCEEIANLALVSSQSATVPRVSEQANPFSSFESMKETKTSGTESNDNSYQNAVDTRSNQQVQTIRTPLEPRRNVLIIDTISFDVFSAFTLHPNMGPILSMRTCLAAFCQFSNPMSSQFSSRIVRIEPIGKYEHLLSFSDVVDFMITVPKCFDQEEKEENEPEASTEKLDSGKVRRDLERSNSIRSTKLVNLLPSANLPIISNSDEDSSSSFEGNSSNHREMKLNASTLGKYYRSLIGGSKQTSKQDQQASMRETSISKESTKTKSNMVNGCDEHVFRSILSSSLGAAKMIVKTDEFVPMNMTFIFGNGKIALFEFTEPYAIRTRESQLERYDYSKIIQVDKDGENFVITILTRFDRLIKVVI